MNHPTYDNTYLKTGLELAKQHEDQFDMRYYLCTDNSEDVYLRTDNGEQVDAYNQAEVEGLIDRCGTTLCLAGWVVVAAMRGGLRPLTWGDGTIKWYETAQLALNLTDSDPLSRHFYGICHLDDTYYERNYTYTIGIEEVEDLLELYELL